MWPMWEIQEPYSQEMEDSAFFLLLGIISRLMRLSANVSSKQEARFISKN